MTFYCTSCWAEVPESSSSCPTCGDDIEARQRESDYAGKLIAALRHPEPMTPIRAAWILGERRERKAVEPLMRVVQESEDLFIGQAAVEALGKIGDRRAQETIASALNHRSPRLRRAALSAMRLLQCGQVLDCCDASEMLEQ